MSRWRKSERLSRVFSALGNPEVDSSVRNLVDVLGGEPIVTTGVQAGEPGYLSKRLRFSSGGELILRDGVVAAVILRFIPSSVAPRGADLSQWITRAKNSATLDDLEKLFGAPPRFAGPGWRFAIDAGSKDSNPIVGGYARFCFDRELGWKKPGGLAYVVFALDGSGSTPRPEDDDCPTCSELTIRTEKNEVDVANTIASLAQARDAERLTESARWVQLKDLLPLHASGLMKLVESQLTCTTCGRTICFTLYSDDPPTVSYLIGDGPRQRPLAAIPPVEQWGDDARIAEERTAMHYVDHEPGAWFLVEQQNVLYLETRVNLGVADDSALIQLNEAEIAAYLSTGRAYLSELAQAVGNSSPHSESSRYFGRDLFRGHEAKRYRAAASRAIINHTWLARQRQAL